jgi:hypothetical protein
VETFAEDMAKAIGGNKEGLIKKLIHEEEEHEAQKKNLSPKSEKNRLFMSLSVVLVVLALGILIFFIFFNKNIKVVPLAPQTVSIIFTDQTDFKPIDGFAKDQIVRTVLNQINSTTVKIGGIDGIYLTENNNIVGFKEFNSLIKSSLTPSQVGLISDNFLPGVFNDKTKNFFILLNVRSFADIFPVMQIWENKMLYDLGGFFGINITSGTNYLFTKNFEDGIVANKNARILRDNSGNIVLMYVFADDNSVIITNSESTVDEIILRLNSSQIKK